jgi:hypothetical protein
VAGGALCVVDLFSALERTVGVANFHRANLADPLGHSFFRVVSSGARVGRRNDKVNQRNDAEDRHHEGVKNRQQQLTGGFDGAGVAFFVIRVLIVSAHGVLKKSGLSLAFALGAATRHYRQPDSCLCPGQPCTKSPLVESSTIERP